MIIRQRNRRISEAPWAVFGRCKLRSRSPRAGAAHTRSAEPGPVNQQVVVLLDGARPPQDNHRSGALERVPHVRVDQLAVESRGQLRRVGVPEQMSNAGGVLPGG